MVQLVDVFAKPVVCLLSRIIQWFDDNDLKFVPASIYLDARGAINKAHPQFHEDVSKDPGRFLETHPDLVPYLNKLMDADKKLFLITNR